MSYLSSIFKDIPNKDTGVVNLTDDFFGELIYYKLVNENRNILVVTPTLYEANTLYNIVTNLTDNVLLFPMEDFLTSEAVAISPDFLATRLETIKKLNDGNKYIIITHYMGYTRFLPTKEEFYNSIINLKVGDTIDPQVLGEKLINLGYKRESLVTSTGEVGVRGFVIDVFPIDEEHPVRIEFFGDEIDSIKYFDEDSQKSMDSINSIKINPFTEYISSTYTDDNKQKYLSIYNKKLSNIEEYIDNPIVFYKDYDAIKDLEIITQNQIIEYKETKDKDFNGKYLFTLDEVFNKDYIGYNSISNVSKDHKNVIDFKVKEIEPFNEDIRLINDYLNKELFNKKTILIYLKDFQVKAFTRELKEPYKVTDEDHLDNERINIITKERNHGFIINNLIVITDKDLFKSFERTKYKYKTRFKYSSKIKDINKLNIGDYVVHNIHGIGIYNGIKTLNKMGLQKDYLEILYAGKDKLYIPVEKIELISKYSANDGAVPKLNRLSGTEWAKTKLRVRNKIKDIAGDLLKIYAEREASKGFAFSKDNDLMEEFEKGFEYQETEDQLRAIEQIKEDMESSRPMDRLLCGDVGYGKTEVAFRAAFKAILDSKQVLYLCPTTILSNQQYNNALERFKYFPVNIGLLNRYTPPKEVRRIKEELENGKLDLLIGTHRLLSDDILPKDLGLLIIDEEQRFGVEHKEKIKKIKANVDVLTLTATPIPRTLQMSLVGIRSLSLIETPPVDRYPIQTYVLEENTGIIKDAIYKELSRNGQIFILYNNIADIERKMMELSRLVPEARIVFAHGRMNNLELEDKMMAFINHEYDILLCTTIIETGIDIPNVNTLIILDADRFGLSQLYQIRGRVGRSNKIAYAYLTYKNEKLLSTDASKRLNAIKEFTELGSGFSIATRDLSIRGAGDILGSEQAGFIDTVGVDLYLRMLNEEVMVLTGKKDKEEDLDEQTDTKPLIDVATHIDDKFVTDDDLIIEIHKKINEIDSMEKLESVKKELEDRFGHINETLEIYMYEELFEAMAKASGVIESHETRNYVELIFSEEVTDTIDGEKIFEAAFKVSNMFRFKMIGRNLSIILDTIKLDKHKIYYLVDILNKLKDCKKTQ